MKIVKWVVVLLILGGAAWGVYRWNAVRTARATVTYNTDKVTRGDILSSVTATGTLAATTTVQVGSQVSGIIQKIFADFNSTVTEGQVICQLDPSLYKAQLAQAEANLAKAKANLEQADLNLKRSKELLDQKVLSQQSYEDALTRRSIAIAELKQTEASLELAQVNLSHTTIFSPISGVVINRNVDVGQTVAASLQAPTLFTIAKDLREMQIEAAVDEADIGRVRENAVVTFTVDAFPERRFTGRVVQIRNTPVISQGVVTYLTIISVDNSDLRLKPGMTANASILVEKREAALRLPNAALRFRPPTPTTGKTETASTGTPTTGGGGRPPMMGGGGGGGGGRGGRGGGSAPKTRTVHILAEGKPSPVEVTVGITDGHMTEVVSGLEENQEVIISVAQQDTKAPQAATSPFSSGMPMRPGGGTGRTR